ncbi:MAG: hypothetical protein ABIG08_02020 [bacterium]
MLEKIKQWIIKYQSDIILVAGVILISLLSFAAGFIAARQGEKEPIKIEGKVKEDFVFFSTFASINGSSVYENSYNWSWDKRALSGLEIISKREFGNCV